MNMDYSHFLGLLLLTLIVSIGADDVLERAKRFLVVPPTAPTRHQLICGIGVPTGSEVNVISGWVLKGQYFIPTIANDLKGSYWPGLFNNFSTTIMPQIGWGRKKREILTDPLTGRTYEKYYVDVEELATEPTVRKDEHLDDGDDDYWQNDMNFSQETERPAETKDNIVNTDNLRWLAYRGLESLSTTHGYGGRSCVLRGICEAAHSQFTHENGLLSEILNIVMSPSSTSEGIAEHSDNEYLRAEKLGKMGEPCDEIFHECKRSILDVFTQVKDPADGISKFFL